MKGLENVLIYQPWIFELLSKRCSSRAIPVSDTGFFQHPCVCFLRGLITSVWACSMASERVPFGMLLELQECAREKGEHHPGELCDECRMGLPDMIADSRRHVWDKLYRDFALDEFTTVIGSLTGECLRRPRRQKRCRVHKPMHRYGVWKDPVRIKGILALYSSVQGQ